MIRLRSSLLAIAILLSFSFVHAQESSNKEAECSCGDTKVVIATQCSPDSIGPFPNCFEQTITFVDKKSGEIIKKIQASGELFDEKDFNGKIMGRRLDFLVGSYACVEGKDASYLMLSYYNGGNCEECEWYEIYNLKGEKLTGRTHEKISIKKQQAEFDKIYRKLGLPQKWPM